MSRNGMLPCSFAGWNDLFVVLTIGRRRLQRVLSNMITFTCSIHFQIVPMEPLYLWDSYHLLIHGAQLWKPFLVYLTQYSNFIWQNTILILISQISLRSSSVMVATVQNWKAYAFLNSQHCATRLYWTRLLHNRSIYTQKQGRVLFSKTIIMCK